MTYSLMIVEDDSVLRNSYARGLREVGFSVTTASDGSGAIRSAAAACADAIVMDIGLPDSDGRDVCQALRASGVKVPVLFLTARAGLGDRLSGFSAGGDDYLVKPFAFAELVARLNAVLSRVSGPAVHNDSDLFLDPATHSLNFGAARTAMTPTEFRVLARMLAAPEVVVRRRELIAAAWPAGALVSDNTLDQYVSKLRRKLGIVGSPRTIEAARGLGYRVI